MPKLQAGKQSSASGSRKQEFPGFYLTALAHSANEERVLQGNIKAATGDADVWKCSKREREILAETLTLTVSDETHLNVYV